MSENGGENVGKFFKICYFQVLRSSSLTFSHFFVPFSDIFHFVKKHLTFLRITQKWMFENVFSSNPVQSCFKTSEITLNFHLVGVGPSEIFRCDIHVLRFAAGDLNSYDSQFYDVFINMMFFAFVNIISRVQM